MERKMYAVIFEVKVKADGKDEYLAIATKLKEQLVKMEGFISIERFSSLVEEGKLLSLSFWEDEEAINRWKSNLEHMNVQMRGRESLFEDYRIRVAHVLKDYTLETSDLK
jgi:heme-degrading monooxygenase HmoA